jgi:hypothetical protein
MHAEVLAFRQAGVSDIRDRGKENADTDYGRGHELKKGVMSRHRMVGVGMTGVGLSFLS